MAGRKEFNSGKFKEVVLYLARSSAADEGFGMVKLNKLLYRADFESFRLLGHSITGATYERQEYGPVARELLIALDELGRAGYIGWQHLEAGPYTRHVPEAIEPPDIRQIPAEEKAVLEAAIRELADLGGKAVSKWSHEESAGWRVKENGQEITYESGLISLEPLEPERLALLREYVSGLSA